MDVNRWQRVEQLCHAALELDPGQQPAFLDGACAGDEILRHEVESLLAHRNRAEHFIEAPALEMAAEALAHDESYRSPEGPRWIGRVLSDYRIVDKVGSGGMGEIYRAVRSDGAYEKQVAIKLVQSGLRTDYFLARFMNERQILASLDHSNIAKLIDGGSTDEGLPYVVMEYIEGQRIDEYCEQQRLGVPERLKLFCTACSAVQYAHKKLVVHRDLKPGNILVTQDGVPKLLDFGIAKILHPQREPQEAHTTTLLPLLTPDYASPEQVRNEGITTSSDVYSLGVVLYVLLTGRHPYKSERTGPHDLIRAICETEPEKPSIAVARPKPSDPKNNHLPSSVVPATAQRHDEWKKLRRALVGDVDNIVLKALRKEPERRYASVEQFSEDIRRHLARLPVIAHKDTLRYRARKFVSRNKLGVGAVAVVILSLLAGLIITLREARIARFERARAEQRFNDVRKMANSLMFEVHDSIRDLPGATAARKLIIQHAQEYLDSLAQESKSDPSLLRELAAAYARLASVQGNGYDANVGDTPKAVQNSRKAVELLEAGLSLDPSNRDMRRELAERIVDSATIFYRSGDKSGYKASLDRAVQILENLAASNPEDLKTEADLAGAYAEMGYRFNEENNFTEGLTYQEKALTIFQRLATTDPRNEQYQTKLSFSHKRVGGVLIMQNQLSAALEHERAALEIDEAQLALHPDSARTRYNITFTYSDTGFILGRLGDFDGAINQYRKALAIRAVLAAADPQDTKAKEGLANTHNYIGWNLCKKGDLAAALVSYRKGLALRETLSEKDPADEPLRFKVAQSQSNIGDVYAAMAFRPEVAAKDKLAYCRESEIWNRKALPMWQQMKAEGKILAPDLEVLAKINQNLESCGHITAPARQKRSPEMALRPN